MYVWGNGEGGQLGCFVTNFKNTYTPFKLPAPKFSSDKDDPIVFNEINNTVKEEPTINIGAEKLGIREFWDKAYDHKITQIYGGVEQTTFALTSLLKPEYKSLLNVRDK